MAQIGTIRLSTGGGTVDVPVFNLGDSDSSVYEYWRVSTDGGTGFVPLTDPSTAAHPYLRVSTGSGTQAVHTSPTLNQPGSGTVLDSFEDGDMSEYSGVSGSDESQMTIQSPTVAYDGSNVLQFSGGSHGVYVTNGLGQTIDRGDTIRFHFYPNGTDVRMHCYFFASINGSNEWSGYTLHIEYADGDCKLRKGVNSVPSDNTTILDSDPLSSTPTGEWIWAEITSTSTTLDMSVYGENGTTLSTLSATDSDYSSNGIGWGGNPQTTSTFYMDYANYDDNT